jgi:ABC-type glycerol-3-phosphate transport system substrate-binding protein
MRPDDSTPGGSLLASRIAAFEEAHPGLQVDVRVKAESGTGGLREMLGLAALAAPGAMPDAVALDQSDLQAASLKGLLVSLAGSQLAPPDKAPWAAFAAPLSMTEDTFSGLPFAADCEILVQSQPTTPSPPLWTDLLRWHRNLYLPLADPKAIFLLSEYLEAGGRLPAGLSQVSLDAPALTATLQWLYGLSRGGILAPESLQIASFHEGLNLLETGGQGAISDFTEYAAATRVRGDLSGSLPPIPMGQAHTLVTGWSWAVTTADPQRQRLAIDLVEWLSDPKFIGSWTRAQGLLPARTDALSSWPDDALTQLARACLGAGDLYPSDEIVTTLAPVLSQAARSVLVQNEDPGQATSAAISALQP